MNSHQRRKDRRRKERNAIKMDVAIVHKSNINKQAERILNSQLEEYMNQRERQSLDRYITGNYGEDQFAERETYPHRQKMTMYQYVLHWFGFHCTQCYSTQREQCCVCLRTIRYDELGQP